MDAEPRRDRAKTIREWLKAFLIAFLVVLPFHSAVADWNDVPTGSLRPTGSKSTVRSSLT